MLPELTNLIGRAAPGALGWLLTYAIDSTLLLGLAWLLAKRSRSHRVREALWKTAMVGGFITATVQTAFSLQPLGGQLQVAGVGSERGRSGVVAGYDPAPTPPAADFGAVNAPTSIQMDQKHPQRGSGSALARLSLSEGVVLVWSAGVLVLLASYLIRRLFWQRRLAARRPVMTHPLAEQLRVLALEAGITRPIRLTATPMLASPIALGRNEIAVPEAALSELDADQQRGMLAHELAHLERRDPAWLTAIGVIERVAFFQPLNRIARKRFQESAEYLCDEWAVRQTGEEGGHSLASCLAKVAEWLETAPALPVAGMAEERSHLVGRVRRLLEGAPFSHGPDRRTVLVGGSLAVALAVMSVPSVSTGAQTQETGSPDPQSAGVQRDEHGTPGDGLNREQQDSVRAIVRALMVAAKDPEVEVRRAALESLARYEDRSTIPVFREALRDEDREIRSTAIEALADFKDRGSVGDIAAMLRDENVEIRRSAANAMSELPARGVMDQLVAAMKDPDAEVRERIIRALEELKDPAAEAPLVAALRDPKPEVRARAISALHELDLPNPPNGLLEMLKDPSADVRHEAAHAVAHYKDVRAVPALRGMLEDPDGEVREAAVEALSEIRTEEALNALMGALKSKDPRVRKAAAEALGQK